MKFSVLNLNENLMKGIHDAGFSKCMPVQEKTFVHTLKGKDVAVQSQTGTGKTAVFLITIFQHFISGGPVKMKKALIIAPTRELAVQIEKEAKLLGKYLDYTIGSFYGGVGYYLQEQLLKKDVDIMVGTPGRLLDLNQKGLLDFKKIGYFIIDEADRLLDMGFLPDIRRVLSKMVPCSKRQTMLFSATLDSNTRNIAYEHMNDPVKIEISTEQITVDKITQELYHVAKKEKMNLLLGVMKKEMPKNALIFTNMKTTAAKVAKHLEYNGYKCLHISGDLSQKKRLSIMENFKAGNLPFLVATDVAARGLHIDDLELIINYDLPGDCENYVHRIGRTARAGKSGKAISLACEQFVYNLEAIEDFIDMKVPVKYAEDNLFEVDKGAGKVFIPGRGRDRNRPPRSREKSAHRKAGGKPRKKTGSAPHPASHSSPRKKSRPEDKPQKVKSGKPPTGTEHRKKKSKPKPASSSSSRHPQTAKKRGSLEDRLEYYRNKYGDNFNVKAAAAPAAPKGKPAKKSFFKKISTVFKGKKQKGN